MWHSSTEYLFIDPETPASLWKHNALFETGVLDEQGAKSVKLPNRLKRLRRRVERTSRSKPTRCMAKRTHRSLSQGLFWAQTTQTFIIAEGIRIHTRGLATSGSSFRFNLAVHSSLKEWRSIFIRADYLSSDVFFRWFFLCISPFCSSSLVLPFFLCVCTGGSYLRAMIFNLSFTWVFLFYNSFFFCKPTQVQRRKRFFQSEASLSVSGAIGKRESLEKQGAGAKWEYPSNVAQLLFYSWALDCHLFPLYNLQRQEIRKNAKRSHFLTLYFFAKCHQ